MLKRFFYPFFLTKRTYYILAGLALMMVLSLLSPYFLLLGKTLLGLLLLVIGVDYFLLFSPKKPLSAVRNYGDRFSNGDLNTGYLILQSQYSFPVHGKLLDELCLQLQHQRAWQDVSISAKQSISIQQVFRPTERGLYQFNRLVLMARSPLGLVVRAHFLEAPAQIKVYPSYVEVRKYSLLALSNARAEAGSRAIRRIGNSMEFEQIKEYVPGDDVRRVNWKATARRGQIMVNHYTDERAQQIYCVVDKSRVMAMQFNGLTLLDYAINASLMLLRVALLKQDKAGLITFSNRPDHFTNAERQTSQMATIMEALYRQETQFQEADMDSLYALIQRRVPQRSLLILFTNFESKAGLERQLPYLKALSAKHLLLVVFFNNEEILDFAQGAATDLEQVYKQTIAKQYILEKKLMVRELQQHGIASLLTSPAGITPQVVNRYLEMKARMLI